MVEPIIHDPTQELGYLVQRNGLLAGGKHAAEAAGNFVAEAAKSGFGTEAVNSMVPAAGAFNGVGGVVGIGFAAAVSAALTQMDYLHRKDNLAKLYQEELAMKFGKPVEQVNSADLEKMAQENRIINEELTRSRRQRNFGLGLSFIASMAGLALITALPFIAALAPVAAAVPWLGPLLAAPTFSLAGLGAIGIKSVVGVVAYNVTKAPLHYAADKMFGIDNPTTNDHIVHLGREQQAGKAVTREQVLSVFVAANPALAQHIVAEYGKPYDALPPETQEKAAADINQFLPLDKLTLDINMRKTNVTELAFAVEGVASGVSWNHHEPEKKQGILTEMYKGMVKPHMEKKKAHAPADGVDASQVMAVASAEASPSHPADAAKGMHASRLGARRDPNLTHVQQLEQSNAHSAVGLGTPG